MRVARITALAVMVALLAAPVALWATGVQEQAPQGPDRKSVV